jgi:hypothetical protein
MTKLLTALIAASFAVPMISAASAKASGEGLSVAFHQEANIVERRKPRIPGGSGCDDPRDIIEHPECR